MTDQRSVFDIRPMRRDEWEDVAELIHESTNAWYVANGKKPIFNGPPSDAMLFCEVYEALDPGHCLVAESSSDHRIAASCFYHPRPTHLSLGIMNVHPDFFGQGLAGALLSRIIEFAKVRELPVRLVSSSQTSTPSLFTPARASSLSYPFRIYILKFPRMVRTSRHPTSLSSRKPA